MLFRSFIFEHIEYVKILKVENTGARPLVAPCGRTVGTTHATVLVIDYGVQLVPESSLCFCTMDLGDCFALSRLLCSRSWDLQRTICAQNKLMHLYNTSVP